jgi:hypothetical protein
MRWNITNGQKNLTTFTSVEINAKIEFLNHPKGIESANLYHTGKFFAKVGEKNPFSSNLSGSRHRETAE